MGRGRPDRCGRLGLTRGGAVGRLGGMAEELHKRIAIIGSADPARTQPTPSTPHTSDLGDLTALQFQTYDLFSVAIGFLAGLALDATYQRLARSGEEGTVPPGFSRGR